MRGDESSHPSWEDDEYVDIGEDLPEDFAPDDDEVTTLLFTATNPPGTVSASAVMDGRIVRIELSSQATRMTESQLAQEITLIAKLARRQAQAAQHALAAKVMQDLGHDSASTRSFLERELSLPSPQTVRTEKADIFATRYAEEHE